MNGNPYTSSFTGATGEYPINEKIDLTSNILNTKIDLTSNTLNKKIDDNTYATLQTIAGVDNHYKTMIDEKIETQTVLGLTFDVKHTYITNSNINTSFGEIRFYNQMQGTFNINPLDPNPPPYKVKVATNGKLYLYYSYDPAIAATITGGWIDFNQLYGRLIADNINQGLTLAALQYEISSLSAVGSVGTAVPIPNLGTGVPTVSTVQATQNNLAANVYSVQSRIAATTGGGVAVAWGIGYAIYDGLKNNDLANAFVYQLKQNKQSNLDAGNITDANTIQTTIDYTCNNFFLSNLSNLNNNFSNLSLIQGFINSNVASVRCVSNLSSLSINYKGNELSNLFINTSNYSSNLFSNCYYYTSNLNLNCSNYASNLNLNLTNSTNTSNLYTIKKYDVLMSNINFWYDGANNLNCYDLNIEKYASSIDLGSGYKSRAFRISTFKTTADWINKNNLLINNQYINYPETLTVYMNNVSNVLGNNFANDNYANGIIMGKTNDSGIGTWNLLTSNSNSYNYIRYISKTAWDLVCCIEPLL